MSEELGTLKRIERRLERLERTIFPMEHAQPIPQMPLVSSSYCPQCGIKFEGATGYVCPQRLCPKGLGGAWS